MKNAQVKEIERMVKNVGGVSFAGLTYTNKNGEKSRYTINMGIDHKNVLTKDLDRLAKIHKTLFPVLVEKFGEVTAQKAFDEVQKSLETSIDGTNVNSLAQIDAYLHITKGLKIHIETGQIHLTGYRIAKKVLVKGQYPIVKSRPLTLAKNEIDKHLKRNKYRQFVLSTELEKISIMGKTLELVAA